MEIFSYKQKKLINKNIAELRRKQALLSTNRFIKDWIYIYIGSIESNLETIFFEKKGESFATLKKNLNKLNKDRVYEIIKILVSFYMSFTERNPSLSKTLKHCEKAIGLKQKDFEDEIFSFFSFNSEDIETFREIDNRYKQGALSPFFPRKILEKAFDSPSISPFDAIEFRLMLHASAMSSLILFEVLLIG